MDDKLYYLKQNTGYMYFVCNIDSSGSMSHSSDYSQLKTFTKSKLMSLYGSGKLSTYNVFELTLGHEVEMVTNFVPKSNEVIPEETQGEVVIKD